MYPFIERVLRLTGRELACSPGTQKVKPLRKLTLYIGYVSHAPAKQ